MLKKRVVWSRHPPKCGTNDSGLSVPLAVPILAAISLSSSEPEDGNASGGKNSIRTGGARIRTMARSTRRRAITRASLVVATRIRSTRSARGDATPVQHTPYADGAAVLIATLSDQTSLPWPDEFARSSELRRRKPISRVMTRFEFRRRLLGFPGSSSEMAEMIVLSRSCHAWPALPAPPSKGP
jgi:hypothetical protein